MSGETEADESGWTVDTIHYYFQKQIDDLRMMLDERYATQTKATEKAFEAAEKAVDKALESAEKAVTKAETAANARFESVNEFRGQLADQANTFISKAQYNTAHDNLVERVNDLQDRMNRNEGKSTGYSSFYGWAVAGISVIIAVVIFANSLTGKA